ncbi:MAG: MFS transporter [Bacteroidales bacterium]|jgi:OPA family sugar phosphate sensor protein UhpC-like MFS transporter|nr:MFS transporter [Bacteroidales bacterium]MCI1784640.1 MFS transporter [Bacteroidales bacterium]
MAKGFLNFYKISGPSATKVAEDKADKMYKKLRIQAFLAATFGYSLYYVCRTTLNVVKQPIIDSGLLDAAQLGVVSSCLLFAYAIGKFVNGFLADYCNIKRFMATGLVVSAFMNFLMGIFGFTEGALGITNIVLFLSFSIMWCINGWAQSMGAPPAIISLSRWFPLKSRGTFYGFFSASHNFGEGLSFLFVGLIVSHFGWQWGYFGASLAGALGVFLILFFLHDNPESKGLPPVEVISGEKTREEYDAESGAKHADSIAESREIKKMQTAVLKNPGVWILALSSAFMYMSRYAINGWGMLFLQKAKGFTLQQASMIILINTVMGVIGTVFSGWFSDTLFKGDRKYPAFIFGVLNTVALCLFLFGGNGWLVNALSMVLFGIAIGVLICFLGGLMAVDLVPRKATGAALGIVGMASYIAAGLQDIISGRLIERFVREVPRVVNGVATMVKEYDFHYAAYFWIAASVISFLLPILNWHRKQQKI